MEEFLCFSLASSVSAGKGSWRLKKKEEEVVSETTGSVVGTMSFLTFAYQGCNNYGWTMYEYILKGNNASSEQQVVLCRIKKSSQHDNSKGERDDSHDFIDDDDRTVKKKTVVPCSSSDCSVPEPYNNNDYDKLCANDQEYGLRLENSSFSQPSIVPMCSADHFKVPDDHDKPSDGFSISNNQDCCSAIQDTIPEFPSSDFHMPSLVWFGTDSYNNINYAKSD